MKTVEKGLKKVLKLWIEWKWNMNTLHSSYYYNNYNKILRICFYRYVNAETYNCIC